MPTVSTTTVATPANANPVMRATALTALTLTNVIRPLISVAPMHTASTTKAVTGVPVTQVTTSTVMQQQAWAKD